MASRKPSILPLPEEGTRSIQPGQRQSLSSQVRTILLELSKSVPPTSQPEATHKILLPPCMIEPADDDWSDDLNGLGHIVPANDTIRVTPARSAFASMQPPIQTHRTTIPGFSAAYTTTKESNSSGRSTLPEGVKLHTTRSVPVAAGTILPSQGGSLDLLKTNPGLGESGDITTQEMCRKKLEKELAQIRATILREQNIAAQNELKRITSRTDPDKLSLFRVATDSHKNDSQHEINLDKASGEINNQSPSLSTKPTSVSTSSQTLFNLKALRENIYNLKATIRSKVSALWNKPGRLKVLQEKNSSFNSKHTYGLALAGTLVMGMIVGFAGAQKLTSISNAESPIVTKITRPTPRAFANQRSPIAQQELTRTPPTTTHYIHQHRITLRNDGMPATIASGFKGYLLRDFSNTHPSYRYGAGTATRLTAELKKLAPGLFKAISNNAQIGDTLTIGSTDSNQIVLIGYQRHGRELLSTPVILQTALM